MKTSFPASQDAGVIEWRAALVHEAGFDRPRGQALAADRRIDLHAIPSLSREVAHYASPRVLTAAGLRARPVSAKETTLT